MLAELLMGIILMQILIKSISEGNNINSVVVYKMHDDNYPWMLPYSDEDSFMTIWMKFYYNIPQETELVWVDYEK